MAATAVKDDLYPNEALEQLLEKLEAYSDFADESVVVLARRALALAEDTLDRGGLAKSLYFLAEYHDAHDHLDESLALLLRAYDLRAYLELPYQLKVMNLLARMYYYLSRYPEALTHALEALALNTKDDYKAAILSHHHLARSYLEMGAYELALEHFQQQGEYAEKLQGETMERVFYGIADVYERMENYDEAISHYLESMHLARKLRDIQFEGAVVASLANIYLAKKNHDEALRLAKQSLTLFEGNPFNLKAAYLITARIYEARGEREEARSYYQRSLEALEHSPDTQNEAEIKRYYAQFYLGEGAFEKAQHFLREALVAGEATGSPGILANIYEVFAMYYEHLQDFERALHYYKTFYALREQALKEAATSRTKAMLVKFEVARLRQEQESHRQKTIELSSLVSTLEQLSHQDSLTGLYNRRFFDARLKETLETARRTGQHVCVMLADIDNFKLVNDTFSHAVGDDVLKIVSDIFMKVLRGSDIVARYGGEEIVVLFVDTTLEQATFVCEKIRHKIEHYPWAKVQSALQVTISMGLAGDHLYSSETLLAQADVNLYRAKRNGKNRLER